MQNTLRIANVVLGSVNLALFVFWLSLIRVEAVTVTKETLHLFDQMSFHISVLEAVVALVGIILAVLGFVGFQVVLERAEARADRAARAAVQRLHEQGQLSGTAQLASSREGHLPAAGDVPRGGATQEQDV